MVSLRLDETKDAELIAMIESLANGQLSGMVLHTMKNGYKPISMQFEKAQASNGFELAGVGGEI